MCAAKPSLFSRPAWAADSKSGTSSGEKTVFGQQRVYDEILAEEARKREEREARREAKADKAARKEKAAKEDDEPGHKAKKRRISKEQSNPHNSDSDSVSSGRSDSPEKQVTPEPAATKRTTRSTPSKQRDLVPGLEDPDKHSKSKTTPPVISLDDDDDEVVEVNETARKANDLVATHSVPAATKPVVSDEDDDDDPFIQEIRRKAREKARQRELERSRSMQSMSPVRAGSIQAASRDRDPSMPLSPGSVGTRSATDTSVSQTKPPALEPNMAILIRTLIPGTKDLVINRHSSQSLLHVKNYWCERYRLEPAFAQQVFFTWRGTRLYNSTTMASLVNILKKEQGIPLSSDEDPSNGKIQIDAVTADVLEQQQKAKDEAAKAQEAAARAEMEEEVAAEKPKKDGIVLILKCKDVDEMTLRVRPNTSVAKIMRAFQTQRDIDRTKTCWLVFDGDRLDPASLVQDVGFEHQDEVEVHPR